MKFFCEKSTLADAVGNVQRAVSGKTSIPALEGILIKASGSSIFLAGYDMEVGITTMIEADVKEPGDIVLNARQLGDIVRRLPDGGHSGGILVETEEGCNVKISAGTAVFHIIGIAAGE
jgi:DNA polymerase-3 subunit beta